MCRISSHRQPIRRKPAPAPCRQLLAEERDRPTAVFGANDVLALGAMEAARDAGLPIPDDIAIAGFDDIPAAKLLGLTTVRQPEFDLGALAAQAWSSGCGRAA